ncbi:MAG: hypothetical protein Kow0027_27750 [Saprospiraceae bacterium]
MKWIYQITLLTFFGALAGLPTANAQLYEVSLNEKIQKSSLIIEGRVVAQESYKTSEGEVYTANKIAVSALLKGNLRENYVTVTTWGGIVGKEIVTWWHMLELQSGDEGIFFLERSDVQGIPKKQFPSPSFEVYASSQGFLKYTRNKNGAYVATEPFHTYTNLEDEIYGYIKGKTGQERTLIDAAGEVRRTGIRYFFKTDSVSGTTVHFSILVNSLYDEKMLHKAGASVNYNTDFFGSNIATNGNLQLQTNGISANSVYSLTKSNLSSSKVKIELSTTGSVSSLSTLTTTEQVLAKASLAIENPFVDPDISFDVSEMYALSKFWESGSSYEFDTVVVETDFILKVCPDVVSFSPAKASAGTGTVITVYGDKFGNATATLPPPGRAVLFTKTTQAGTVGHQWMMPFDGEYLFWSDDSIKVKVPSIGYDYLTGVPLNNTAGTGIIGVLRDGCIDSTTSSLYVPFSAINEGILNSTGAIVVINRKLTNRNGSGGYDLYYTNAYKNINDGAAMPAFEKSVVTWRCATGVNWRIKEFADIPPAYQNNACKIDYGPMPAGVPAALVAYTEVDSISYCGTSSNDVWFAFLKKFSIVFSNTITWSTDTSTSIVLNWMDTLDMQTVATHELGHAHQLFHSNNPANLMFWLSNGYKRTLHADDLSGGNHIVHISAVDTIPSCQPAMQRVAAADCGNASTGVLNIAPDVYLQYFPNPASGYINVIIENNSVYENLEIRLFNFLGQQLMESKLGTGGEVNEINLDGIPSGLIHALITRNGAISGTFQIIKL